MKPDVKVKVPPDIDTDKEEFLAIRSFSLGWEDFVFELNLGIPISVRVQAIVEQLAQETVV